MGRLLEGAVRAAVENALRNYWRGFDFFGPEAGVTGLNTAQFARLKRLIEVSAERMKSLPPLQIDLASVRVPVLAITGEFDRPAWRTQRLWRELQDFRSVVLAGKNHLTAAGNRSMGKSCRVTPVDFARPSGELRPGRRACLLADVPVAAASMALGEQLRDCLVGTPQVLLTSSSCASMAFIVERASSSCSSRPPGSGSEPRVRRAAGCLATPYRSSSSSAPPTSTSSACPETPRAAC